MSHILTGTKVPNVTFKTRVRDESLGGENPFKWLDVTTSEVFDNKKVVIFGLPGAFTPTCSSTHLPGYEAKYNEFKALGVDAIYCISVNDAFVMYQWGKNLGAKNVQMLPDGNAEFTKQIGMLVKKENLGFGDRSWRYSMFVDNGMIKEIFAEADQKDNHEEDPFEVSDADTMYNYIKGL
jgi:thioredoxin-dependent peroxiredoxin